MASKLLLAACILAFFPVPVMSLGYESSLNPSLRMEVLYKNITGCETEDSKHKDFKCRTGCYGSHIRIYNVFETQRATESLL